MCMHHRAKNAGILDHARLEPDGRRHADRIRQGLRRHVQRAVSQFFPGRPLPSVQVAGIDHRYRIRRGEIRGPFALERLGAAFDETEHERIVGMRPERVPHETRRGRHGAAAVQAPHAHTVAQAGIEAATLDRSRIRQDSCVAVTKIVGPEITRRGH
ncbi:hypothetical protein WJ969_21930 [Achromobacter xylosoxidans]